MPFNAYTISKDGVVKYVGVTTRSVMKRWSEHILKSNGCEALARGFRKHGIEAFTLEHVASAVSDESLNDLERLLISQYGTNSKRGYNLTSGGQRGFVINDEVRAKISAAKMGKPGHVPSEEGRRKISATHKGKSRPEEWGKKIGLANLGRVISAETRAKISAAKNGKPGRKWSEEEKQRSIARQTGLKRPPFSQEWRAKMSASRTGKRMSAKAYASFMARVITDATRAKISASLKGRVFSPETIAKMSAATRAHHARQRAANQITMDL